MFKYSMHKPLLLIWLLLYLPTYSLSVAAEAAGYIGVQAREFFESPADPAQGSENYSLVISPEWYQSFNDNNDSLNLKLFYRYDSLDSERSHADLREFFWLHVGNDWELTLGVNKVYWGVTESQHLVDIINQTDTVEAVDGEEKLGQSMVHLALIKDYGVFDFFVLPGFRSRTFPGEEGRLRSQPITVAEQDHYQSDKGDDHIDYAMRWSSYYGNWSVGLSWFHGTNRDPILRSVVDNSGTVLEPYYTQIDQLGLDLQYNVGDWIWKLEAIYRQGDDPLQDDFIASTTGFEYTLVGFHRSWDLGLLMEYSHDSRSSQSAGLLQNDMLAGGRLSFNDASSSELLFGVVQDLDANASWSAFVELSTRVGDATRVLLEVYSFSSDEPDKPLYSLRRDSYLDLSLEYYF